MPDVNGNLSSSGSSGRGVSLHCQDRLKPSVVASPRTSLPFSDHLPQKVPKKPPSAYYMFYRDYFQQNPEEFKHLSTFGQYSKVIAEKWAKLDEDAKKIYHDNNKLEMQQYKTQMVQYYASQEFKNYQVANHQIEQRIQNIENTSYLNKDSPNRQIADTQYFTESSFDYLGIH